VDLIRTPSETRPGKMAPLARLPVFLALEGKRAVVAGGSAAAAWKVELLSAAGARVDVYAETPSDELLQVAGDPPRGAIAVQRRGWTADDLKGAAVAIGAFEDDDAAAAFAASARALGVPVNVIDKPAFCDFAFGAIVNRSPLVIGISTDGAAPVFAQAIRAKLEALLPKGFADWAAAAARWRVALKASSLTFTGRRKFWHLFTAHAIRNPDSEPAQSDFDRFVAEVQGLGSAVENGSVTLVGAGPGDPELLTLRAVRALQSADVILFDDLVSRDVLDFARREARKMLVGKTGFGPSCKQDDINALMVSLAKQGKRVVRLKGGDPMVFGRVGEEIEALRAAGIPFSIVPGVTAATASGAVAELPLTHRDYSSAVIFITGHQCAANTSAFDWSALSKLKATICFYMGVRRLPEIARNLLGHGMRPDMPLALISEATLPTQQVHVGTLIDAEKLSANLAGQPALVVIGEVVRLSSFAARVPELHERASLP